MTDSEFILSLRDRLTAWKAEQKPLSVRLSCLEGQIGASEHLLASLEDAHPVSQERPLKLSFARRIREVLQYLRVASPKEVADVLLSEDIDLTNENGRLVIRVNSELYRMVKSGNFGIRRPMRGKYSLTENIAAGPSSGLGSQPQP